MTAKFSEIYISTSKAHTSKPFYNTSGTNSFFSNTNQLQQAGFIQPKLSIGRADDPYEREADKVAEEVIRMPDKALQMKCPSCEDQDKIRQKPLIKQTATSGNSNFSVSPEISNKISSTRGLGSDLPKHTLHEMSSKIGADFSHVNIHTDDTAAQLNHALGAKAFTVGHDIYFNEGQYKPTTTAGKKLMAHELTHVIQQSIDGQVALQRTVDPAICDVLNFEEENGTWATIREYNALTGNIPGRGLDVMHTTGGEFDLNWALDVSYVAGMTGGTCSDILGTVFGSIGVTICAGTGYTSGGMSYYFARAIGAAVEGYEHGAAVGLNYLTYATIDETNLRGAEVGMLVGASGASNHPSSFRAFVHESVLQECGLL